MYPNRLSRVLFLNLGEDCTNLSEHCQGLFGNWLEIRFLFPVLPSTSGDEGTRTPDFLLAKQALSQLSYGPRDPLFIAAPHARVGKWWVWMDLNHRPHAYQACALTN